MKKLFLRADGTFRILQVADAQDMHFVRKAMLTMLNAAYEKLDIDLVVFTGDNILGNHLCDRRFGQGVSHLSIQEETLRMKKALGYILSPLQKRGVPFTMIFGNHDDFNRLGKDLQFSVWKSYSCFLPGEGSNPECRELAIYDPVTKERALTLWLIDTARYDRMSDTCYETVTPDTVRWLQKRNDELLKNSANAESLVFAHIPLPGITRLFAEGATGVPFCGKKYQLDRKKADGFCRTYPSIVADDSGLSDMLQKSKNMRAVISGHDHTNCFVGKTDQIQWIQTSCASFRCYGEPSLRGVRLLVWDKNRSSLVDTTFYSYYDLCGRNLASRLSYFWNADECEKKKAAFLAAGGIAAAGIAAAGTGMWLGKRTHHK